MKILSVITEGKLYTPEIDSSLFLNPDQLVLNALEVLLDQDHEALPVYNDSGKCVGIVYTKDLIWFLTCDNKSHNLLFHKFNFSLYTAVMVMKIKTRVSQD